ncbi:MAG: PAS domain S-box protein, partial [Pyrinomonadaceae bacterium]|nr:PAS domain S-box protein [Sphingobacteriaceae bacterium]
MQDIQKILSPITDAVWSFDLVNNKFIYFNQPLIALFETPIKELHEDASFWLPFIHPEDYQYATTESQQVFEGKNIEIEYRLIIKGKVKWVLDKKAVLFDDQNIPQIITGILSDITSKKTAESNLTYLEKTFRYLFINNPNPLWIYDRHTLEFLEVNNAAIAKYGYSKDEFLAMTIADIRPKEDLPELHKHVKNVENRYLNTQRYWRHLKKNGEILYVNVSGHGINHKGREAEIVMSHDITLEVESRQTITLAKENLDALINSIKEDIWSIDSRYKLISANNAYKQSILNSVGKEPKIGDSIFMDEYDKDEKKLWLRYYDKALSGETFSFIELVKLP